jgi:hypothetical protein
MARSPDHPMARLASASRRSQWRRPVTGARSRPKNLEAESHDVYESKEDTAGVSGESHDVVENKQPILQGA